jgi:hypothetical protein
MPDGVPQELLPPPLLVVSGAPVKLPFSSLNSFSQEINNNEAIKANNESLIKRFIK